ncbi:MAG: 3'-5' exonuclease [Dehalococcoidales bacterium]|nr:3'-5' exonuclease [Dehalococcoidales bacterium]
MTKTDLLSNLNPPQKKAVETVDGPVLILAGPGSGKTRVITHRIAYLVGVLGVRPHHIMAVTFTNKAAREMSSRLEALAGSAVKDLTLGTFHAICVRILRREGKELGINPGFTIYDGDDQLKLVKAAIKQAGLDPKNYTPGAILSAISAAKSELLTPEELSQRVTGHFDEVVVKVYEIYRSSLARNNALDFDDLLMKTVKGLAANEAILKRYQEKYRHILVDEFQDTNLVQYELVKMLSAKYRNICVVGDPDQSIYSWRSADIRNILNFEKDFPDVTTIYLEQNYRSTRNIIGAAQAVIDSNKARKKKTLWTENEEGARVKLIEAYDQQEEARLVINEISKLTDSHAVKAGDIAVLFRTNAQSRALEEAFVRYGIPYRLAAGTKFYERREIRDILAYLKMIFNPADSVSLLRVINVPARGIGRQTLEELMHFAVSRGVKEAEALSMIPSAEEAELLEYFSLRSLKILKAFAEFVIEVQKMAGEVRTLELFDRLISRIEYKNYIISQPEGEDRWQNVLELRSVAQQYNELAPEEGLAAFLESVSLVADTDSLGEVADSVNLITLHQAKGLEFPVVFIVGMEENVLPHYRSIDDPAQMEEERRLCYVGITRAKTRVYLCRAYRRMLMGNTQVNDPSRFIADIPQELFDEKQEVKQPRTTSAFSNYFRSGNSFGSEASIPIKEKRPAREEPLPLMEMPLLKAGNRVRHAQFGEGIVVSVKPSGTDQEVVVAFDGNDVQIKRLMLSFARLEKIQNS